MNTPHQSQGNGAPQPDETYPTPLEILLMILAANFVGQFLALLAGSSLREMFAESISLKIQLLVFYVGFGGLPLLYFWRKGYDRPKIFRLRHSVPTRVLSLCAALGAALYFVVEYLARLLIHFIPRGEEHLKLVQSILQTDSLMAWLLLLVIMLVMEVLVSEGVFRGVLLSTLEQYSDVTRAVIVASVASVAVKFDSLASGDSIYLLVYAFLLTWLSWRAGSLLAPLATSFAFQLIGVIDTALDFENTLPGYTWGELMSPLYLVVAIAVIYQAVIAIEGFYRSKAPSSSME